MKCNVKKLNEFFENSKYEQDIIDFVLRLYNYYCSEDTDIIEAKFFLLDLGFYEVEKDDIIDHHEDFYIVDFYKLSLINKVFRSKILELLYKLAADCYSTDFFSDMITNDLKILLVYDEWLIAKRKNKLNNLNNINL